MRKLIITGMAVAMLAVPAAASAGGPTGSTVCDQAHPVAPVRRSPRTSPFRRASSATWAATAVAGAPSRAT